MIRINQQNPKTQAVQIMALARRATAARPSFFAFDFDGVLCDSALETALSGWKACQSLWPSIFHQGRGVAADVLTKFRVVRPILGRFAGA